MNRAAGLQTEDWAAPGAFQVASGVYRIPLPLPNDALRAVNSYAIVGSDEVDVVDPGWNRPESKAGLAAGLAELGIALGDVRNFLVTHVHRDHYTQAVALRSEYGTRVSLGAGEKPSLTALRSPSRRPLAWQIAVLHACGAGSLATQVQEHAAALPPLDPAQWAPPDVWLTPAHIDLQPGRSLEVIETPGHTRGHVVFHDAGTNLLFAGDHVLPTITPSIGFEEAPLENPLAAFLASLARVRSLPDALLLPAHGGVAPSVHARVDELVDHHGRRLERTEEALYAGATTPYEVARELSWTRRERRLYELDNFNQMLAVLETRAHLALLSAQGRAAVFDAGDGLERYRATQAPVSKTLVERERPNV